MGLRGRSYDYVMLCLCYARGRLPSFSIRLPTLFSLSGFGGLLACQLVRVEVRVRGEEKLVVSWTDGLSEKV